MSCLHAAEVAYTINDEENVFNKNSLYCLN